MNTMLTYNTNSKTGPVCGGRAMERVIEDFTSLADILKIAKIRTM